MVPFLLIFSIFIDLTSPAPPPPVNAWDKPITATLRTSTPPTSGTAISVNCLDDSW